MAYDELAAEARRIVRSPYPTSLQQLEEIVCRRSSQAEIDQWTLSNPCLIQPLVATLLEGLKQWPYVLDIVTSICSNKALRDAMLAREPCLLEWLVQEAVKPTDLVTKYAVPAISILSQPLPRDMPCPAGVQTLFIRLFDHAAKHPSAATVKPIYKILKGAGPLLVNLLSHQTMSKFEEHVFSILQNHVKGMQDDCLNIYCLAIMKLLTTSPELALRSSSQRYDTQDFFASASCSTPKWRSDEMEQFFHGSKGHRTMQLVVLQALWICRSATKATISEACENLVIANEVVDAVPTETKKAWTGANGAITGKLLEKLMAAEADPRVQLHGLSFAASVFGVHNLPLRAKDTLGQKVLHVQSLPYCEKQYDRLPLLDHGIEVADWKTMTRFASEVMDFVCDSNLADSLSITEHLITALDQLSTMTVHMPAVTEGVSAILVRADFSDRVNKLAQMLRCGSTEAGSDSEHVCGTALRATRCAISRSLSSLLLSAAYASEESRPSASTVQQLLNLHALACASQEPCTHQIPARKRQTPFAAFAAEEPVPTQPGNGNWKEALDAHLQLKARQEYSSISNLFAQACVDLEKRCEDIEAPIRSEKERYDGLQQQYDELSRAYSDLEAKTLEEGMRFDTLQSEKEMCEVELEASHEEVEGLARRLSDLEERLRSQEEDAEERLRDTRRGREDDALQHATVLANKEGQLEEMAERQAQLQEDVASGQNALQQAQQELEDTKTDRDALRTEIETLQKARSQQQDEITALDEVERALTEQQSHLNGQIEKLQNELAATKDGGRDEVLRIRQEAADSVEAARVSHEEVLARLATERDNDVDNLRNNLAQFREEAKQAQQQYKNELAQRNAKLQDYYKKIEKLQQRCHRKDDEIAQANAMRTNLMAAMGIGALPGQQPTLAHRARTSTTNTGNTETSELDISPPTPGDTDETEAPADTADDENVSFASNVSSGESKNGPTPKRPRPARKSLRASTTLQTQARASVARPGARQSLLGRDTGKRHPLLGLSVNMSPSKGATRSPVKGGDGGGGESAPQGTFDDSTLDGSDVFASTPGRGMLDLGQGFEGE
ncbi:hypothetical protein MBLNU230_g6729t1 [Neophaeotheca triangularis]